MEKKAYEQKIGQKIGQLINELIHDFPVYSDVLAMGKKREHNAISVHQISFDIDFVNSNSTRMCSRQPVILHCLRHDMGP